MDSRYVGDGYPLCTDLPEQNFLRKGATFRMLGSNPRPDLLNDPEEWWSNNRPVRLSLDAQSSLATILCNSLDGITCSPKAKVVLGQDLECTGLECTILELRTFEVGAGSGLFFEYVRPPCVNHVFYRNAASIRRRWGESKFAMCGDPGTLAASTVCCNGDANTMRQETFSGERVTVDAARARCQENSKQLCSNPFVTDWDCNNGQSGSCDNYGIFYWSSLACSQVAKVNAEGKVAVVHQPQITGVETHKMVTSDTKMYFKVDWQNTDVGQIIPDLTTQCAAYGCNNGEGGTCLCNAVIQEVLAFTVDSAITSVEDLLSLATIGAFPPRPDEIGEAVNGIPGLWKYPSGALTKETVFQLVDSNGQTQYRKNAISTVILGNGTMSFRNPVTFYLLSEPTVRDAAYEVDAALVHAFYHRNIAPFLAIRFAQRFGVSNPSPRYVSTIAKAFRSGYFEADSSGIKYGTGRYGCLTATIAAVVLDREFINILLDADPVQ
jgi:hypothetical protein